MSANSPSFTVGFPRLPSARLMGRNVGLYRGAVARALHAGRQRPNRNQADSALTRCCSAGNGKSKI
jgi:hypothetical protein